MTFEDSIDLLLEKDFYLQRAHSQFGPKKFHVMIGQKTKLYAGEGNTLSEALTEAISNHEKGKIWPPVRLRKASSSVSHKELDDELKDFGIDLN